MRIRWVEVQAFRSFRERQGLELNDAQLAVIYGLNSQGKTSLVEAVEFLFSGSCRRSEVYLGGYRDFRQSLRNAHARLELTSEVSAEIEDDHGNTHVVSRVLREDFTDKSGPRSTLRVGSVETANEDLARALGLPATQPLCAVLCQHSLRLITTLKPQERADHFKAMLSVDDLERFRDLLDAEVRRIDELARSSSLTELVLTAVTGPANAALEELKRAEDLRALISSTMSKLLGDIGCSATGSPQSIRMQFEAVLNTRRAEVFPLEELKEGTCRLPSSLELARLVEQVQSKVVAYSTVLKTCRTLEPVLERLYEAALELYDVNNLGSSVDCPLCETKSALTPIRLRDLRDFLKQPRLVREARSSAEGEIGALQEVLLRARDEINQVLPAASKWREPKLEQVRRLVGQQNNETSEEWKRCLSSLEKASRQYALAVGSIDAALRAGLDTPYAIKISVDYEAALQAVQAAYGRYQVASTALTTEVKSAIDEQQRLGRWNELIQLWDNAIAVVNECRKSVAARGLAKELKDALNQVDRVKSEVLNEKINQLSMSVSFWWNKLRPGEPVRFSRFESPGKGIRFLDLKAAISGDGGTVVRDAIGVFSDSQLNCLGLSIFAARAIAEGAVFIVMDDPVQSLDQDHLAFFRDDMVQGLLDKGRQVLIMTHLPGLRDGLATGYKHALPWVGNVEMPRGKGSQIKRVNSTIMAQLDLALDYLSSNTPDGFSNAGRMIRVVIERLVKAILVEKQRTAGNNKHLLDYSGCKFGQLIGYMQGNWLDPAHQGRLKVHYKAMCEPAHDSPPPGRADCQSAVNFLKHLYSEYKLEGY